MTDHLCPVCTRRPRRPGAMTCEHCPATITRNLREIRDLYPLLAAATTPGQGTAGPHVSGSREAPVPLLLHVVDLAAPADDRTVSDPHGDQVGAVSIASVLDGWVSDWIDHRAKGEHQPLPTVPELARWLLVRVDDACDSHDAIHVFAAEVFGLVCAVRSALQISRTPESMAAPCPRCEMLALKRDPGSKWVECRGCGRMLSQDEYARLVGETVKATAPQPAPEPSPTAGMSFPVRCAHCRGIYDLGKVTVTARYADCSMWKSPCCGLTVDDRGAGWKVRADYVKLDRDGKAKGEAA